MYSNEFLGKQYSYLMRECNLLCNPELPEPALRIDTLCRRERSFTNLVVGSPYSRFACSLDTFDVYTAEIGNIYLSSWISIATMINLVYLW